MISFRRFLSCARVPRRRPLCDTRYFSDYSGFYNRHEEVENLKTLFNEPPKFTVVLGPPSSGKTALVRHVATQLFRDKTPMFHPIFIDLRGVDVASKDMFKRALIRETFSAKLKDAFWKKHLAGIEFDMKQLKIQAKLTEDSSSAPENVGEIFDAVMNQVPTSSVSHGARLPILVVDEANELRKLGEKDRETLESFLRFVVKCTKQEQRLHVVFTSSDSFFQEWLSRDQGVDSNHFDVLVVGDLTKAEAYQYYLNRLDNDVALEKRELFGRTEEDFDRVYHLTGGRMYFIRNYVLQICRMGPIQSALDFMMVSNAMTFLQRELIYPTIFSTEQVLEVFKMLTSSKSGYLDYLEVIAHFKDKKVVEEMIHRNILHFRPKSNFARDLQPTPEYAVVTASGHPSLRAMEQLIKKGDRKSVV